MAVSIKMLSFPLLLSLAGCATITKGTTEQITFNSDPPGAEVQTTIGFACPSTPCSHEVSRKQDFVATFSMPGYISQQIPVISSVGGTGAAGLAGNVLAGGVIGMGVDAATGSALDHSPNPVYATMQPERSSTPALKRRNERRVRHPKSESTGLAKDENS